MATTTTLAEGGHAFLTNDAGYVEDRGMDPHTGPYCVRCEEQFCTWCDEDQIKGQCPNKDVELPGLEF